MGSLSKVWITLGICLAFVALCTAVEAGKRACRGGQCNAPSAFAPQQVGVPAFTAPATAPQATAPSVKPFPQVSKPVAAAATKVSYHQDLDGKIWRTSADGSKTRLIVIDTVESVAADREVLVTERISKGDLDKVSDVLKYMDFLPNEKDRPAVRYGCKCGPNCKCATEQKTAAVTVPANVSASWQMIAEHCESASTSPSHADTEVHVVHVPTPEDVVHATVENVESFVSTLRHRDNSDDAAWDAIQVE